MEAGANHSGAAFSAFLEYLDTNPRLSYSRAPQPPSGGPSRSGQPINRFVFPIDVCEPIRWECACGGGGGGMLYRFGESPREGARLGLRARACFRTSPPGFPVILSWGIFQSSRHPRCRQETPGHQPDGLPLGPRSGNAQDLGVLWPPPRPSRHGHRFECDRLSFFFLRHEQFFQAAIFPSKHLVSIPPR